MNDPLTKPGVGKHASVPKEEVSALARGISVVQAVADSLDPPNNRDLAAKTRLPKATVSRLAATLVSAGYLRLDKRTDRYYLGTTLLRLSHAALRDFEFRQVVRPYLVEFAEAVGANVHIAIQDHLGMLVIDTVSPRTAVILVQVSIGARMDLATSAAGRAWLAGLSLPERQQLFDQLAVDAGENWGRMKGRLDDALNENIARGYCTSYAEWHPDINAIAISVRDPTGTQFVINCGGPAYIFSPGRLENVVAPRLLQLSRQIADRIGD